MKLLLHLLTSLIGPSATSLDVRCLVAIGGKAVEGKAGQNRRSWTHRKHPPIENSNAGRGRRYCRGCPVVMRRIPYLHVEQRGGVAHG